MKVKQPKRAPRTEEQFVREWVKAHREELSLIELSKRLGEPYRAVYGQYRKHVEQGIQMPPLRGQRWRTSKYADRMNALIHTLLQEQQSQG